MCFRPTYNSSTGAHVLARLARLARLSRLSRLSRLAIRTKQQVTLSSLSDEILVGGLGVEITEEAFSCLCFAPA